MKLIGRKPEQQLLRTFLDSSRPEFLAVYGRRRVGKTYLVRTFFENEKKIAFLSVTGAKNASLKEQIKNFITRVCETFSKNTQLPVIKNWNDAFRFLTESLQSIPKNLKVVIFLDEFPWMETKNSRLIQNLDYFWNQYWSRDPRFKLIICGSSASWIIRKIIQDKGGLHNRVTHTLCLEPFNLRETQDFLSELGVQLNQDQVTELYMVLGGIPHYLSKVQKGYTATQVIEEMAFRKKSFLLQEFDLLFASLFDQQEIMIKILRAIAESRDGIEQSKLFDKVPELSKGSTALSYLSSLEDAGFILSFTPHLHQKRGVVYKAIDEYTLFYFHWIEPIKKTLFEKNLRPGFWEQLRNSPAWYSWSGYAFECICYKHLTQISQALRLSPTALPHQWRYSPTKKSSDQGAQIDLLFERQDKAITLCEIKYTQEPFILNKAYAQKLKQKTEVFKKITRTNHQLFWVMISAHGVAPSDYVEEWINHIVTLKDLFREQ